MEIRCMQDMTISRSWFWGVLMSLWEAAQLQYASKQEWKRRWRTGNKNPHSVLFIGKYIIMQSHELGIYTFKERQKKNVRMLLCGVLVWYFLFLWKFREKTVCIQQNPGASRQSKDNFWQVQAEILINFMECWFLQSFLGLQIKAANESTQELSISADKEFQILEFC